jgi:uncharacterized protein with HEPN domain
VKDDHAYLLHILDSIGKIFDYTTEGREGFFSDTKTQDAVVRNLEIIGEAVKRVSPGCRDENRDIPWKQIAGMRDRLIHDYFGVDMKLVWAVIGKELRPLERKIQLIVQRM